MRERETSEGEREVEKRRKNERSEDRESVTVIF